MTELRLAQSRVRQIIVITVHHVIQNDVPAVDSNNYRIKSPPANTSIGMIHRPMPGKITTHPNPGFWRKNGYLIVRIKCRMTPSLHIRIGRIEAPPSAAGQRRSSRRDFTLETHCTVFGMVVFATIRLRSAGAETATSRSGFPSSTKRSGKGQPMFRRTHPVVFLTFTRPEMTVTADVLGE